ncbi:hypothetical protein LSAT2_022740 [Lamellibrachia satsuma]|nr:hypothetical protein LSAT2_022740 [Lamellibrachia satsuma]
MVPSVIEHGTPSRAGRTFQPTPLPNNRVPPTSKASIQKVQGNVSDDNDDIDDNGDNEGDTDDDDDDSNYYEDFVDNNSHESNDVDDNGDDDYEGKKITFATRECMSDGTWFVHPANNRSWTNYSECIRFALPDSPIPTVPQLIVDHMSRITLMYKIGYGLSLASLILAVFIMIYFKKLHCPRNTLHVNLFLSFILRASISFLKDNALIEGIGFPSDVTYNDEGQLLFNENGTHWQCKLFMTTFHMVLSVNYMWIFIEALYLHMLIFVSVFSENSSIRWYLAFGWYNRLNGPTPYSVSSPGIDNRLNGPTPYSVSSPGIGTRLNGPTPYSVSSPGIDNRLNGPTPYSASSPGIDARLNGPTPYSASSPGIDARLNGPTPYSASSPGIDTRLNGPTPYSASSPGIDNRLNGPTPYSASSPGIDTRLNGPTPYSASSPGIDNRLSGPTPYSVSSPGIDNRLNGPTPYSVSSPGIDTRLNGPTPYSVSSPGIDTRLNGPTPYSVSSPGIDNRLNGPTPYSVSSPGIDTRLNGPTPYSVSSERHRQSGVDKIGHDFKRQQVDVNPVFLIDSPAFLPPSHCSVAS